MQALDVDPPRGPDAPAWLWREYEQFQAEFDGLSARLDEFLARLSHITAPEDQESVLGIKLSREHVVIRLDPSVGTAADRAAKLDAEATLYWMLAQLIRT